jgi:hypothetical protein
VAARRGDAVSDDCAHEIDVLCFDYLRAAATSLGCTIWPVAFDQWFFV